jgi:hypothetical protein
VEQAPGASFEATYGSGTAGLVGTLEVAIIDNDNVTVFGPTAAGIIENIVDAVPTGVYTAELTAPVPTGAYSIVWSEDGTWAANAVSVPEELLVVAASLFPPIIPPVDGGPADGPCTAWVTGQQVALCCDAEVGSDYALFDEAIVAASEALFMYSGRRYTGTCTAENRRPCATRHLCGVQVLSRGYVVTWDGSYWALDGKRPCGCSPLSRVLLPGYPVREILEVKIDGVVVPASNYRLDEWKWLTAMNGNVWPACQRMDLDDTEEGTFAVSYTYGKNPGGLAQDAALELACEIYKSCSGAECRLPAGTTRITRQGVTIERNFWRRDPVTKAWRTGLTKVDTFLNALNPSGLIRRPTVYSPDIEPYARRVGS